jgi:tetratricopeptide (TPR) repeat protein
LGFGLGFGTGLGFGFWDVGLWGRGHWWGGAWHGGPFWHSMWHHYPMWANFGITPWCINRVGWGFGYWDYMNPYWVGTQPVVIYDYRQPLVVHEQPYYIVGEAQTAERAPEELPPGVTQDAVAAFDAGLEAFKNRDFNTALERINVVIQETPQDSVAHEFRSMTLFALGRYDEAAEAIYAVLAVSPGWDWETVVGLYPSVDVYTQHLRALEQYTREHPDSSPARFLLAYQYMTCGHEESAVRQLKRVLELTPDQKVATDLLIMFEGPEALEEIEGAAPTIVPPEASVDVPEVKPEQVVGNWTADSNGASFKMNLNEDGTFTWAYTRGEKSEKIEGVWEIEGNVLALEPATGGVMLAELGSVEKGRFTFKMTGAPPSDPGLNFSRAEE